MATKDSGDVAFVFMCGLFAVCGAVAAFTAGAGGAITFQVRHLVREVPADHIDPHNEGMPIVVRSEFRAGRYADPEYGVEAEAAFLQRLEATFTTFSTGSGKNRTTVTRWGSPRVVYVAQQGAVTFGAFRLSDALLRDIGTTDDVPISEGALARSRSRKTCKVLDGRCYTGDPAAPRLGDRRISFRARAPGSAAIFGAQSNATLTHWSSGSQRVLLVGRVDEPLASMLNRIAKVRLGIGTMLIAFLFLALALGTLSLWDHFPEALAYRFRGVRALNYVFVPLGLTITMDGLGWMVLFPRLGAPIIFVGLLFAVLPLAIARPR